MGYLTIPTLGKVHYHEYGSGTKPMLAFHGYGMTGRQFHVLKDSILAKYQVYGFDHFFHGESKLDESWTEKDILQGMPREIVKSYLEEWFSIYGRQRVSLLAYSIGANFALILLEEFPDMIGDIILMAPDGLSVYKGFDFLMHNVAGKFFFRRATKSKWLAPSLLKNLKRIGFIDSSLHTIAYNEIDTSKKRQDVYYTLNIIKQLKPDTDKIVALINQYQIKTTLVFGKDDKLFPLGPAKPFIAKLDRVEVLEVPFGHWLVVAGLDDYLNSI